MVTLLVLAGLIDPAESLPPREAARLLEEWFGYAGRAQMSRLPHLKEPVGSIG